MRQARPEVGAEIELAPNRKPYLDDEELEGPKLERTLIFGVAMLVRRSPSGCRCTGWPSPAARPARSSGFDKRFASWGAADFATTADGGFNCAGCHGGMTARWRGRLHAQRPEHGRVRRRSLEGAGAQHRAATASPRTRSRYILNYGRPFSPMSPWGTVGGGPMNEQQIQNIIDYLEVDPGADGGLRRGRDHLRDGPPARRRSRGRERQPCTADEIQRPPRRPSTTARRHKSLGEALFNLELNCGRLLAAPAATPTGWSYGDPKQSGGGAFGPEPHRRLDGAPVPERAPTTSTFIETGSEHGKNYGQQGQGSGACRASAAAHRGADPGHRRLRAWSLMDASVVGTSLVGISWAVGEARR